VGRVWRGRFSSSEKLVSGTTQKETPKPKIKRRKRVVTAILILCFIGFSQKI
jgi:hypothetical protein